VQAAIDAARVVDTPLQAGLDFTVRLDKPDFVGRAALFAQRGTVARRLLLLALDEPDAVAWGDEPSLRAWHDPAGTRPHA
jgi:glycine cleavage system aminomethyltransferase T